MNSLKIERMAIKDLKPWSRNPKKHNIDAIIASIERYGITQPILIEKGTNRILAGHGRIEALQKMGETHVPVIMLDIHGKDADAYTIIDNQTTMMEGWDEKGLGVILGELKLELPDLNLVDFDLDDIVPVTVTEDDVPEPSKVAKSKRGEIYTIGNHRLMCGDATSKDDVARLMEGKMADMVLTDPPYGLDRNLSRSPSPTREWRIAGDDSSAIDFYKLLGETKTKTRYIWCGFQTYHYLINGVGVPDNIIVWVKNSAGMGHGYRHAHEFLAYYGDDDFADQKDVWESPRDYSGLHPTIKPLALVSRAVTNSSKTNDLILDPFGGSGTTLIACEQLGRVCYMMEIDPIYVDVIIARWEKLTGKKAVRG